MFSIGKPLDGPRPVPKVADQQPAIYRHNCDRCDVSQRLRLMQCLPSPLAFCLLLLLALLFVAYYCRRAAAASTTSTTIVQVFRALPAFFLGIEITHHINSIFVPFTGLIRCVWPQIVETFVIICGCIVLLRVFGVCKAQKGRYLMQLCADRVQLR